jgi:pimeloyl-ACP methyl ester carboxylesterase
MDLPIGDVAIHYVEHGTGVPLIALHGSGVDHRETEAGVEAVVPRDGYRRIYPDLPGMGRSTSEGLSCNDDVVGLLCDLIDRIADGQALLLGHSYGAHLARGVAARRPDAVLGLALLCPIGAGPGAVPEHRVVRQDSDAYAELGPEDRPGFDDYFVVRTRTTARRYRDCVLPGIRLADEVALTRIFAGWSVDVGGDSFAGPSLIAAGRGDAVAGYAEAVRLADRYPRATLAVLDGAGHALMHERPDLLAPLLADWLARAAGAGGGVPDNRQ